jgi:hypothetical protein
MSDPKPGAPLDLDLPRYEFDLIQSTKSIEAREKDGGRFMLADEVLPIIERLRAENARLGSGVQRDGLQLVRDAARERYNWSPEGMEARMGGDFVPWSRINDALKVAALATPAPAPSGEQGALADELERHALLFSHNAFDNTASLLRAAATALRSAAAQPATGEGGRG